MSTWKERVRRIVEHLPLRHHLPPLAVLTCLHVAVFARTLNGTAGMPERVIPYDFPTTYARFLIFISDTFRAGALPLWYPYGHAGTPFFVNPQSELWSPVTWLVSLLGGYDLLVAQRQLLLTILVGSIGLYALAYSLWKNRWAALFAAMAFNFTSARLCNAEHMDIINAFSIFPWVFWSMERIAHGARWAKPLLGIVLSMLVVTGYPGVVLLSPLWFGAWAVWLWVTECADGADRRRYLWGLVLAMGTGVLLSTGYWLPIAAYSRFFTRGAPMSVDGALAQSLILPDLLHIIFGASTSLIPDGAPADISMRGLYFGILAFALALLACLHRPDRRTAALGVLMVTALLMSLGSGFAFRVALHDYISIFNLSRFPPADSRAVAVLAGSLLAGGGLLAVHDDAQARGHLRRLLMGLGLVLIAGLLWLKDAIFSGTSAAVFARPFSGTILGEILVVGLALVCLVRNLRPGILVACLLAVAAIDAGLHASADAFLYARTPEECGIQNTERIHKRTFDAANASVPRADNGAPDTTSKNDGFLDKKFSVPSYSAFRLKYYDRLLDSGFRPFLGAGQRIVGFPGGGLSARDIPTSGPTFQERAKPIKFTIDRYLPDRVDYTVDLTEPTLLVFNEMYFDGWKAAVDGGRQVPMLEVAGGLRALQAEAGVHRIRTRFSPGLFWAGLAITAAAWLGVLTWIGLAIRSGRARKTQPHQEPVT